ncbi:hypothetical protein IMCC3317_34460 [Kordia antarctica]|uniref:Uncharacterized protein n=1 Tax=Kordia antarctica TaxID=1218801 RepID=A0A7L4ZN22_9FLAO|nr:hypothetical protein [Kordia antarctica]QHI38062.1 hypothetical protein IMCC3317_34460 [Kordia antarctica]
MKNNIIYIYFIFSEKKLIASAGIDNRSDDTLWINRINGQRFNFRTESDQRKDDPQWDDEVVVAKVSKDEFSDELIETEVIPNKRIFTYVSNEFSHREGMMDLF